MAFVPTPGMFYPFPPGWGPTVGFTNSLPVDATGEKFCSYGRMWNKDGTAKSIRKVGFRLGSSIVKSATTPVSTVTISLQDMSTTVGVPGVPDEVQDQTVTITPNSDSGWVASTWYQTPAFSADRAVAFGEMVAVVFEFGTWTTPDIFTISALTRNGINGNDPFANNVHKSGTWTAGTGTGPMVLLEFSDATFGTLGLGHHMLPVVSNAASSGNVIHLTTAGTDERALRFLVPFDCYCDGGWIGLGAPASNAADFEVILYEGTTARKTVAFDANQQGSIGTGVVYAAWEPQLMLEGTEWFLSVRPTVAGIGNTVSPQTITVANVDHWQCHPGGSSMYQATRVDLGAWNHSLTTTRILAGISISSISTGGGSGGLSRIQGGF